MTPGPCDLATNSRDIDTDASGASLRILIRQTMNLPYIRLVSAVDLCAYPYSADKKDPFVANKHFRLIKC